MPCSPSSARAAETPARGSQPLLSSRTFVQLVRFSAVSASSQSLVFLTVLEFIYTNTCTLTDSIVSHMVDAIGRANRSQVVDVLASAIEYQLEGLSTCCVQYMSQTLRSETVCEAMQVRSCNAVSVLIHVRRLSPTTMSSSEIPAWSLSRRTRRFG